MSHQQGRSSAGGRASWQRFSQGPWHGSFSERNRAPKQGCDGPLPVETEAGSWHLCGQVGAPRAKPGPAICLLTFPHKPLRSGGETIGGTSALAVCARGSRARGGSAAECTCPHVCTHTPPPHRPPRTKAASAGHSSTPRTGLRWGHHGWPPVPADTSPSSPLALTTARRGNRGPPSLPQTPPLQLPRLHPQQVTGPDRHLCRETAPHCPHPRTSRTSSHPQLGTIWRVLVGGVRVGEAGKLPLSFCLDSGRGRVGEEDGWGRGQ